MNKASDIKLKNIIHSIEESSTLSDKELAIFSAVLKTLKSKIEESLIFFEVMPELGSELVKLDLSENCFLFNDKKFHIKSLEEMSTFFDELDKNDEIFVNDRIVIKKVAIVLFKKLEGINDE